MVDCRPPEFFEARVELREKPMEEYPDIMLRSMVIYLAPRQTIGVYMDGKMFGSQEVVQKDIGVDTAEYVINVDGDMRTSIPEVTDTGEAVTSFIIRRENRKSAMLLLSP